MKGASSAPAPDPKIGEAALLQAQTGQDWLGFAKDAFSVSQDRQKDLDALTTKVTQQQLGLAQDQANWAEQDRARYENTFQPVEDKFISDASNYGSAAQQDAAAASARADVQASAANQRAINERTSASLGIRPDSGRYAGITTAQDNATTLAEAGAANNARVATRDKGLALEGDVVNLGRGLPSQAGAAAGSAVASGGAALSGNQATNGQALAAPGIVTTGYQGAMAGYRGEASTLQNQYNSQLSAWQTQQQVAAQEAGGIGQAFGGILGLFLSDENLKEDVKPLPDGTALAALEKIPISEWNYKPGVADEGRHVGGMAQDFKRATGKGDGKTISAVDAIGLSMGAIKDLGRKVDKIATAIGLGQDMRTA